MIPLPSALTYHTVYQWAIRRLYLAAVDTPRLDARLLVSHATHLAFDQWITQPNLQVSRQHFQSLSTLLTRREQREPISRILGRRSFWSLDISLNETVFDPRPESETLITAVLHRVDRNQSLNILDLGTGSGCLLLALLSEYPYACGLGVDKVPETVYTAQQNAHNHNLQTRAHFAVTNWTQGLSQHTFDILVSNPPYIRDTDIQHLPAEVTQYDPLLALSGGKDGLECYRILAPQLKNLMTQHSLAFIEIGKNMRYAVSDLFYRAGLSIQQTIPDLSGLQRCLVVKS